MTGTKRAAEAETDAQATPTQSNQSLQPTSKKAKHVTLKHTPIVTSTEIVQIKDEDSFKQVLSHSESDPNLIIVLFLYATWSTPCKHILVEYQKLLKSLAESSAQSDSGPTEEKPPSSPKKSLETPSKEPEEQTSTSSETLKPLSFTFYKVDKDAGPKVPTTSKAPLFMVYRSGKKIHDVLCQGKALHKKLAGLEAV